MMIQNNRFLPPSPLPHSLLPRGRRQGRYVPFSANHTNGTTYDFLGQLIAAGYSNTGLTDESYSYDSNGNRITANGSNYTTGSNNELTSDGSWTYTYDDEGNRVSKTNSTHRELYEWDYRNRLTKVTQQEYNSSTEEWQDVQIVEYTYDYNNIWIRKLLDTNGDGTPDSKSIFIPENYQTTVQIDDGIVTHHYLWTPNQQDKLLADTTTDGVLWSLTDHLGSIRDIIQQTSFGLVVPAHLIYDVFGNIISCTDSTGQAIENPVLFAYTGKAFDVDTHLQNNINRWYDATIGRWLSTDPIGFHGNDMNLYRYINNRLLYSLDFSGLQECTIFLYIADNEELWEMLYEDKFLTIPKPEEGKRYDLDKRKPIEESVFPSPYQNEWSSSIDEYTFFDIITCWSKPFLRGAPPEHLILPTRKRLPMDKGMLPGEFILDRVELLKKVIPQTMKKKNASPTASSTSVDQWQSRKWKKQ